LGANWCRSGAGKGTRRGDRAAMVLFCSVRAGCARLAEEERHGKEERERKGLVAAWQRGGGPRPEWRAIRAGGLRLPWQTEEEEMKWRERKTSRQQLELDWG
jgi:hypothetical protein